MKKTEVFEGYELRKNPVPYPVAAPMVIFHGKAADGFARIPMDENLLGRHVLVLGGIGTGKTNAFFQLLHGLNANLNRDDVVLIFDTKGDFYKAFYQPGDVVISNDNTARGPICTNYWNIFCEIPSGSHMEESIAEIASTIFRKKLEHTSQPFFPMAARDIFSAVLTHFSRTSQTADNALLRQFFDSATPGKIREILSEHMDLRGMASYVFDDRSPQTQGVVSELQQSVREVFIGNFRKSGDLSLRQLVSDKGGRRIFVEYDLTIGSALTPIYSLMFDMALKSALGRQRSEGNVYLIIDEFSLLPDLQHIGDAVNFGRSLGLKIVIGLQNISQVQEGYGQERAASLLSGFLTTLNFRVNDIASKYFIKERFGVNRKKEIYTSSVQSRGIVENLRDAYVVEDWDISRLATGQAIIGLPGAEPFLFQFDKVT